MFYINSMQAGGSGLSKPPGSKKALIDEDFDSDEDDDDTSEDEDDEYMSER